MRKTVVASLSALVVIVLVGVGPSVAVEPGIAPASGGASPAETTALLRRQTQELMDAVAPGEAEVWRLYLHDDVLYVDENGTLYDKEALLRELTPLPAGLVGRIEVDRFEPKLHGNTVVAAVEVQEHLDYHGQPLRTRFRFMDTWRRTADGWRLVGRHNAAVLKDPRVIRLTEAEMCAYAGEYRLTPAITTTVRCTANGLISERRGAHRRRICRRCATCSSSPDNPAAAGSSCATKREPSSALPTAARARTCAGSGSPVAPPVSRRAERPAPRQRPGATPASPAPHHRHHVRRSWAR